MDAKPNDMDVMSVPPGEAVDDGKPAPVFSADAGTDESIAKRLERDPASEEARLDRGLDESMDASDPPAATQPVHNNELPESSGYDPHHEARLALDAEHKGFVGRLLAKLGIG